MASDNDMGIVRQRNEAFFSGKQFVDSEEKFRALQQRREKVLDINGGEEDGVWRYAWVIVLLGTLGVGIFEANVAQTAIAGLIDPTGDGTIHPVVLGVIGVTLAIFGMWFGHGIYKSIKKHPYSGKRSIDGWFLAYLVAAILYIGFQYYVSTSATGDMSGEELLGAQNLPIVITGVAVLEVLAGVLLVHAAFAYMDLFVLALRGRTAKRKMDRLSRATNENYDYYTILLRDRNEAQPHRRIEREGNENVRRAIAYYNGVVIPEGNQPANNTPRDLTGGTEGNYGLRSANDIHMSHGEAADRTGPSTRNDLDSIIDDSVDDDLTV